MLPSDGTTTIEMPFGKSLERSTDSPATRMWVSQDAKWIWLTYHKSFHRQNRLISSWLLYFWSIYSQSQTVHVITNAINSIDFPYFCRRLHAPVFQQ